MRLEKPQHEFVPVPDRRRHMPEPLPVRLVAIEDMHAFAGAGLEVQLDEFYVGMLKFEREGADEGHITYRSENFRLFFEILEPPVTREDFRPIPIEIQSLSAAEHELNERKIEYVWQRGLAAGQDVLMLQDPAGNWVSLTERREIG